MKFTVHIQRSARRDFNSIIDYIGERSASGAIAWGHAFDKALARLEEFADTMAPAEEDELVEFDLREVQFKTRRGLVYRAVFTIRNDTVHILHVRGPGQDYLGANEIADVE